MVRWRPGIETTQSGNKTTDDPALLAQERVTQGVRVITTDPANIHEGQAYSFPYKFTIAAAGIAYMEILTPPDGYVHFKPVSFESDGPKILVQMVEAPTATPGTVQTAVNRRRLGTPAVARTVVRVNPTGVSGGTVLDQDYIGGGTGAGGSSSSGGSASNDNEWVLKPNTLYHIKVTNNGSGSADVNIKTFWYEEGDG